MKKVFILFLLFQTELLFAQTEEGINFYKGTFNEALAKAKKENRFLFIDCYTSWCGPCKWMAKSVFTNDTVYNFFNSHFINYKLDMEKGEGIEVAKKYGIRNYPTFLWLESDGKQHHRVVGAKNPAQFLEVASYAISPTGNLRYLGEQYKAGNKSAENLLTYSKRLLDAYDMSYQTVIDEYFKTQEGENLTNETNWNLILEFTPNINSFVFNFISGGPVPFYNKYGKDSVINVLDRMALESIPFAAQNNDSLMLQRAVSYLNKSTNQQIKKQAADAELYYYKRVRNYDKYTFYAGIYVPKYFWNDAEALNDVCWTYFVRINDQEKLEDAERWISQSVSLDDSYYNTDTYANILNKLGRKEEAIKMALHSIALAKESKEDFSSTQQLLDELLKGK